MIRERTSLVTCNDGVVVDALDVRTLRVCQSCQGCVASEEDSSAVAAHRARPRWSRARLGVGAVVCLFSRSLLSPEGSPWGFVNLVPERASSSHRRGIVSSDVQLRLPVAGQWHWLSSTGHVAAVFVAGAAVSVAARCSRSRLPVPAGRASLLRRRSAAVETKTDEGVLNGTSATILLVVLAVLYGGNVPLLKAVETGAPLSLTGPEVLTLRFVTASVIAIPYMALNLDKVYKVLRPGIELAFWLWIGYTLQILGLEKTSASVAAISTALCGVTVQALEVVIEGQPLRPVVAASSIGVIAGLGIFATAPGGVESPLKLVERVWTLFAYLAPLSKPAPHEALFKVVSGEALAVLGAIFFGVHVWRCNRIVGGGIVDEPSSDAVAGKSKENDNDLELALAVVQCFVTTLLCFVVSVLDTPYSFSEQVNTVERLNVGVWLQIAACGVICTGAPSVLELFAFKVVPPAVASLIYCTIPLWGTVLGVFFLGDSFGPQSIAGGVIILLASFAPSIADLLSKGSEEEDAPVVASSQSDSEDVQEGFVAKIVLCIEEYNSLKPEDIEGRERVVAGMERALEQAGSDKFLDLFSPEEWIGDGSNLGRTAFGRVYKTWKADQVTILSIDASGPSS